MKTLPELKDEVAKSFGYRNNEDLISHMNPAWINEQIDAVAKRYAEAAIERCAEVSNDLFDADDILKVKEELK